MRTIKNLKLIAFISIVFFACSAPKQEKELQIKQFEDDLFSDENKMVDKNKASELISLYIEFANEFPADEESPKNLFKAGDMAMNLNMPRKAIKVFDRILIEYPDFEKAPQCLFLKGYVYENNLGDLNKAKATYEEFLTKYPDDDFADDAEVSIRNLGKSPEELIKEFEEQAKTEGEI